MTFLPKVYSNQRPTLIPADLDNHPLAGEYILYMEHMKFPPDFKTWLQRRDNEFEALQSKEAMEVLAMQNDPYCRLPNKIRIHRRKGPGRYR